MITLVGFLDFSKHSIFVPTQLCLVAVSEYLDWIYSNNQLTKPDKPKDVQMLSHQATACCASLGFRIRTVSIEVNRN